MLNFVASKMRNRTKQMYACFRQTLGSQRALNSLIYCGVSSIKTQNAIIYLSQLSSSTAIHVAVFRKGYHVTRMLNYTLSLFRRNFSVTASEHDEIGVSQFLEKSQH